MVRRPIIGRLRYSQKRSNLKHLTLQHSITSQAALFETLDLGIDVPAYKSVHRQSLKQ